MLTVSCGDVDFQKTLTEKERDYIHKGDNWISKLGREITLKEIHSMGWTLDEVEELPKKKQNEFWKEANKCWNSHNWEGAKFKKEFANPVEAKPIVIEKK